MITCFKSTFFLMISKKRGNLKNIQLETKEPSLDNVQINLKDCKTFLFSDKKKLRNWARTALRKIPLINLEEFIEVFPACKNDGYVIIQNRVLERENIRKNIRDKWDNYYIIDLLTGIPISVQFKKDSLNYSIYTNYLDYIDNSYRRKEGVIILQYSGYYNILNLEKLGNVEFESWVEESKIKNYLKSKYGIKWEI